MSNIANVGDLSISTCIECPAHTIESDPDPYDDFCDDDIKIGCKFKKDCYSTTGCRPYNAKKESSVPDWCPFIMKVENAIK
ncbi:MAG: hypothetical protein M0R17_00710 [Candidatus Omnitrophica bacterium]|jgi:hypothetical protein|nr:hypothetical protein [Candidatus Omnitrophota bacterium]